MATTTAAAAPASELPILDEVLVDRELSVPLHEQLYTQMRAAILRQDPAAETPLPREIDLADSLGLSRGTVRHAISRLVSDGLVYRTSGRGTFVRPPRAQYSLSNLTGFTQQMYLDDKTPSSRVVDIAVEDAPGGSAFPTGVRRVLRIERIRLADEEPVALETLLLPHPRFAGLRDIDLTTRSVYAAIEEEFGVPLRGGTFTIDIETLDARTAELLNEKKGAPVFAMTGDVSDQTDQTVMHVHSRYRPAHFSFRLDLPRVSPAGPGRSSFVLLQRSPG